MKLTRRTTGRTFLEVLNVILRVWPLRKSDETPPQGFEAVDEDRWSYRLDELDPDFRGLR